MRQTVICAMLVLLAGCVDESDPGTAEEARAAIPSAENIQVEVPTHASKIPAIGQVAPFYLATVGAATVLNGSAALVLVLVKVVVSFPVTSVEGGTFVWGPWTESGLKPGEYRLTVRRRGNGDYNWRFEGRRKADGPAAPFLTIVDGSATPGRPHHGSGSFTIDFDVARSIDPFGDPDANGQLSVTYDLERVPVTLSMDAERTAPTAGGGSALATFHYDYSQEADGSGELRFNSYGDTADPGSAWEMSEIHSRWMASGAGRADVTVTGGDIGTGSVTATECWSDAFLRTYYTDSVTWLATEGDASSCLF